MKNVYIAADSHCEAYFRLTSVVARRILAGYTPLRDQGTVEGVPFQLTDALQVIDPRVHELGEDTSAVLSEVLDLDAQSIASLFKNGIVGGT